MILLNQPKEKIVAFAFFILALGSMASPARAALNCPALFNHSQNENRGRSYKSLGANFNGRVARFGIWAPHAQSVDVILEADGWQVGQHPLVKNSQSGIWSTTISDVAFDTKLKYKYRILDAQGKVQFRNDPYARFMVQETDSRLWNSVITRPDSYQWQSQNFKPATKMRVMEINARTRVPAKPDVNFRELAQHLLTIIKDESGPKFNTVSLMPISQHNVVESWGYQPGGIFAVNYRHGTPDDLKYFIDQMHLNGISVLLDVVLGHASRDWDTGLGGIDGTQLYFPEAKHLGEHQDWGTYIYNFARPEVREFLLSNVKYWADEFHIDGIRLDGVTSMLYRDYSRSEAEKALIWQEFGTNINTDAVAFIKTLNTEIKKDFPNFITVAEESSGWPGVTKPVAEGGLGFDYMWGMGAMHDMRQFLKTRPEDRNISQLIAPDTWNEKFFYYVNSHDETAHGKTRYIEQIYGASGTDKKFDVARVVTLWQYIMRGAPMLWQGDEIADPRGWSHNLDVQEFLTQYQPHQTFENFVRDLSRIHAQEPAFDHLENGSLKILNIDSNNKVLTLARIGSNPNEDLIIILNFSPNTIPNYSFPVLKNDNWQLILNSDSAIYGGQNIIDSNIFINAKIPPNFKSSARTLKILPAYSGLIFKIAARKPR